MLGLVGSGEYLVPMQPVDEILIRRLNEEPKVVCLPTAADSESKERIEYWMDLGLAHFQRLGANVEAIPIIDREGAGNAKWVEVIGKANFVYLSGGKPEYLLETLKDTPAWNAILGVHEKGGVVAGCSAGAMIMGAFIPGFPRWRRSFGLLPATVVVPHFDEIPSVIIYGFHLFSSRAWTLLGIERNTALVVENGKEEVIGEGGVTVWNHEKKTRYTSGQSIE
jgi:cyanophycinase